MRDIHVSDTVRLICGLPTLWLGCGEIGVVKSLWLSPMLACEVEFHPNDKRSGVRALLFPEQFEVVKPQPENN